MNYFKNHTVKSYSHKISFEYFWCKFSLVTMQYKHSNKARCRELWERTINKSVKRKAFDNIHKGIKLNAYEYLQEQFKLS